MAKARDHASYYRKLAARLQRFATEAPDAIVHNELITMTIILERLAEHLVRQRLVADE